MKATEDIVCRQCGGLNDPDSRYCWHCGASLRGLVLRPRKNRQVGWAVRVAKWVVGTAVVVGALYGVYLAVDHYLLPLFNGDQTQAGVVTSTTAATVSSTTTTTTVPRQDTLIPGGKDRYATALVMSELGFPTGAQAVVLAGGAEYADAISAAPLAVACEGPVLLVPPEGIRADIGAELERLGPSEVFLVGVPGASKVKRQVEGILNGPSVKSLNGGDSYETAALVAAEIKARLGMVSKVVIAPADSFIEALTVAPLAGAEGWPILLAPSDGVLRKGTASAMKELEVTSALVIGTEAELSLEEVDVLVGTDSFDTAALIVRYAVDRGLSFTHTAVATGDGFPDGLVTGCYVARDEGILLLAQGGQLPPPLLSLLKANLDDIDKLDFIALPGLKKEVKDWEEGGG